MDKHTPSCVDCGTQKCKFKDRTYPDFCLTTNLSEEDARWAAVRYEEGRNHEVMVASAEVECHRPQSCGCALYLPFLL